MREAGHSVYPNDIDPLIFYQDADILRAPQLNQYYEYLNENNFNAGTNYLKNSDLDYYGSWLLNKIEDRLYTVEQHIDEVVEEKPELVVYSDEEPVDHYSEECFCWTTGYNPTPHDSGIKKQFIDNLILQMREAVFGDRAVNFLLGRQVKFKTDDYMDYMRDESTYYRIKNNPYSYEIEEDIVIEGTTATRYRYLYGFMTMDLYLDSNNYPLPASNCFYNSLYISTMSDGVPHNLGPYYNNFDDSLTYIFEQTAETDHPLFTYTHNVNNTCTVYKNPIQSSVPVFTYESETTDYKDLVRHMLNSRDETELEVIQNYLMSHMILI